MLTELSIITKTFFNMLSCQLSQNLPWHVQQTVCLWCQNDGHNSSLDNTQQAVSFSCQTDAQTNFLWHYALTSWCQTYGHKNVHGNRLKQAVCLWCPMYGHKTSNKPYSSCQTYSHKNFHDNMLKRAVCLLCQMYGHKTLLDNTLKQAVWVSGVKLRLQNYPWQYSQNKLCVSGVKLTVKKIPVTTCSNKTRVSGVKLMATKHPVTTCSNKLRCWCQTFPPLGMSSSA